VGPRATVGTPEVQKLSNNFNVLMEKTCLRRLVLGTSRASAMKIPACSFRTGDSFVAWCK
jgi:hypothetical protein